MNNPPILTVSQLTQAIKMSLESTFPFVCLQGEISNFKLQTSGHLYFSLKDSQAQISVVMFKGDAVCLKMMPKNGDTVLVKGEVNVYPARGNYQLVIRELSYVGLGELLQKLEQLKIKLHQLGWFKSTRKKPLPRLPKRIGVVTSPTGAVIQDILNILTRRFSGFHLILNPVKVQGEGAAQEIAQAIRQFNEMNLVDVMIVGRGGGSIEDLWAFNEEIVAQAIFDSRIPIISAVGHETDHCIADYVADVRAPTPSAAAEIVTAERTQLVNHVEGLKKRLQQAVMHGVQKDRYRLQGLLKNTILQKPFVLLEQPMQRLDDLCQDLDLSMQRLFQLKKHQIEIQTKRSIALKPTTQLAHFKQKLTYWERSLVQVMGKKISHNRQLLDQEKLMKKFDHSMIKSLQSYREKLNSIKATLEAIDPKNLLNKGYSILFNSEGKVINSVHQVEIGEQAKLLMSDGEIGVKVTVQN